MISRGYGRKKTGTRLVSPASDPGLVGDEPLLIARQAGVPVIADDRGHDPLPAGVGTGDLEREVDRLAARHQRLGQLLGVHDHQQVEVLGQRFGLGADQAAQSFGDGQAQTCTPRSFGAVKIFKDLFLEFSGHSFASIFDMQTYTRLSCVSTRHSNQPTAATLGKGLDSIGHQVH